MDMIRINGLEKSFGEVKAVDGISFSVKEGELFAFLGLNGAGKSTTINIMCGVYSKDDGEVYINGENIDHTDAYKSSIGVVYQESALDKALTVKDNLESRAALYGIMGGDFQLRIKEIDELLKIKPFLHKAFGKLSGGQKRRVDIARALIHYPKLLILDEPTTGLDPQTRKTVWRAVDTLRKSKGITVLLTTHYMEEAADADRVLILDSGKIIAEGTPIELKNRYTGDFISLYNVNESAVKKLCKPYEALPEGFRIAVKNTAEATELILKHPSVFIDYEITKGRMDDVFLAATGKKLGGTGV